MDPFACRSYVRFHCHRTFVAFAEVVVVVGIAAEALEEVDRWPIFELSPRYRWLELEAETVGF